MDTGSRTGVRVAEVLQETTLERLGGAVPGLGLRGMWFALPATRGSRGRAAPAQWVLPSRGWHCLPAGVHLGSCYSPGTFRLRQAPHLTP